jgi:hypothetical protein
MIRQLRLAPLALLVLLPLLAADTSTPARVATPNDSSRRGDGTSPSPRL